MQMSEEINTVYSCLNYSIEPNNVLETKQMIQKRLEQASKLLGLDSTLQYATIDLLGKS